MLFDFASRVDSAFNIGLSIKGTSHAIVENYLKERMARFCQDLSISVYPLPFEFMFTDVEFNKQIPDENEESFINKHFYQKLFRELKKKKVSDEAKGREFWTWDYRPKLCFTLDKSLTHASSSSGIEYGELNLGNQPVLYYVWVDVQKVIDLIKVS